PKESQRAPAAVCNCFHIPSTWFSSRSLAVKQRWRLLPAPCLPGRRLLGTRLQKDHQTLHPQAHSVTNLPRVIFAKTVWVFDHSPCGLGKEAEKSGPWQHIWKFAFQSRNVVQVHGDDQVGVRKQLLADPPGAVCGQITPKLTGHTQNRCWARSPQRMM